MRPTLRLVWMLLLLLSACSRRDEGASSPTPGAPQTIHLAPNPQIQEQAQTALIKARPGDTVEFADGTYEFTMGLSLAVEGVTVRGQGIDRTFLSFQHQNAGSDGLLVTRGHFRIEDLTVEDAKGDAIKVNDAGQVTFRRVRTRWTRGPHEANGAYGFYPVQCRDVLIEDCIASDASDAGIYVGQCRNIIVRRCRAEQNVAGIEIENCTDADVHDNVTTGNTGGLLVFDLPGLPVKNGKRVRVFHNRVFANNHANFAPRGNIVGSMPPGTGIAVMATDQVEVFDNTIADNQTSNLSVMSFFVMGQPVAEQDRAYDPIPEGIYVHDNRFTGGGSQPSGERGQLLRALVGTPVPDMLYDGVQDPRKQLNGKLPRSLGVYFKNNGKATFANLHLDPLNEKNLLGTLPRIDRHIGAHEGTLPALPPVRLQHTACPIARADWQPPEQLSAYGLFREPIAGLAPAAGVVPYDVNTPLFADYAAKYRFIRLPPGTSAHYHPTDVFAFPVGTIIAKTFAYTNDETAPQSGRRLIETRLLIHRPEGWVGLPYIWNEKQTEATLHVAGGTRDVQWIDATGTTHKVNYIIPNQNQCLSCHEKNRVMQPIGPKARQLNRDMAYGDTTHNQLMHWTQVGILQGSPHPDASPRLAVWTDPRTGTLDQRARAWLESNCAHCHNPHGAARNSGLDLTAAQTDPYQRGIGKMPVAAGRGSGGRLYDLVPGRPDESILLYRMESTEPGIMMPEMTRRLVDREGVALIRDWIRQLPQARP